jgi:hypothetical protein
MSVIQHVWRRKVFAARQIWVAVCATVVLAVGCSRYVEDKWSRARPATYRAGGVVEYQGQPVPRATITFVAHDESRGKEFTAVGFTDDWGRFTLQTFRPGDGAIAGSHRVTIEKRSLGGGQPVADKPPTNREEYDAKRAAQAGSAKIVSELPARYGDAKTSGLTAEVTEKGPNQFVFRLDDSGPDRK